MFRATVHSPRTPCAPRSCERLASAACERGRSSALQRSAGVTPSALHRPLEPCSRSMPAWTTSSMNLPKAQALAPADTVHATGLPCTADLWACAGPLLANIARWCLQVAQASGVTSRGFGDQRIRAEVCLRLHCLHRGVATGTPTRAAASARYSALEEYGMRAGSATAASGFAAAAALSAAWRRRSRRSEPAATGPCVTKGLTCTGACPWIWTL